MSFASLPYVLTFGSPSPYCDRIGRCGQLSHNHDFGIVETAFTGIVLPVTPTALARMTRFGFLFVPCLPFKLVYCEIPPGVWFFCKSSASFSAVSSDSYRSSALFKDSFGSANRWCWILLSRTSHTKRSRRISSKVVANSQCSDRRLNSAKNTRMVSPGSWEPVLNYGRRLQHVMVLHELRQIFVALVFWIFGSE